MGLLHWWRERRRKIFHFHDGIRARRADPIRVWSLLQTDPKLELPRHVKELSSELNPICAAASLIVSAAVRRAFSLPEFDAGGLTDQECHELFLAYEEWLLDQKKTSEKSPISPPLTGSFLRPSSATIS
jgi:hypothetical protein